MYISEQKCNLDVYSFYLYGCSKGKMVVREKQDTYAIESSPRDK